MSMPLKEEQSLVNLLAQLKKGFVKHSIREFWQAIPSLILKLPSTTEAITTLTHLILPLKLPDQWRCPPEQEKPV